MIMIARTNVLHALNLAGRRRLPFLPMYTLEQLEQKNIKELKEIGWQLNVLPTSDRRCRQNWIDAIVGVNPPLLALLEFFSAASVEQVQPIIETVETPSAVEVEPAQESPIESKFGRIVYPWPVQKSIAQAAENSPGVDVDRLLGSIDIQRQELIAQAAETSPGVESDRHPILRGVTFSDRFLSCYSPPQAQIIHFQSDADGQLSLLNFEIESASEPPDPDDFESLDAFREAIARWDTENSELLAASIDSMCEWAPCPEEWYWPKAEILPLKPSSTSDQLLPSQQSEVIGFSIADESSITCNFFIPTFDEECDRFNRSDEPPDTGIYARLPKSKPPSFSPTALSQARVKRGLNAYQTHTKRIPKVSRTHTHCIVVGSSTQPARSPPGGDACLV